MAASDFGNLATSVGGGAAAGSVVPGIGTAIGAGVGLVEGGIQLFSSLAKEKRDRAAQNAIHDPFYKIQDEFYQNRNIAAGQAQGGLPSATKDYLTNESQRGLEGGISGVLQGGGSVNDIGKLMDSYNKNIDKTASEDAQMHQKNIDYFMNANKDLAGEKIKQWAINKYQPNQEKKKQLSENISADQQNAYAGANTAIGSIDAMTTGSQNNSLSTQLFKSRGEDSGLGSMGITPLSTTDNVGSLVPPMTNSTGYINP